MSTATLELDDSFDKPPGRLRRAWRALRSNLGIVVASAFLLLLVAAALAAEPLAPLIWFRPGRTSRLFWLTPYLLSDPATVRFWTEMLRAAGPTLAVGFAAALGAVAIGAPIGMLAGARVLAWIGRPLKAVLAVVESFPLVVFGLAAMVALGAVELRWMGWTATPEAKLVIVIAILLAPRVAQVVSEAMRKARREPHLAAERALGASPLRIGLRSVLRRCLRPLAVCAAGLVGAAILMETTLTFLGLGLPAATASWGALLAAGLRPMFAAQWLPVIAPAMLLIVTLCAVNYLAYALRTRLLARRAA